MICLIIELQNTWLLFEIQANKINENILKRALKAGFLIMIKAIYILIINRINNS